MTALGPLLPTLLGMLGLLILAIVLTHLAVRRYGGWRVVRRAVAREIRNTVAALTAPVRARRRHRRHVRLLTDLLTEPEAWVDAEQAMLRAEAVAPGLEAYGAVVGHDVVGVYVGGVTRPPEPGEPWVVDERDPMLWWIDRVDVPSAGGPASGAASRPAPPLLVALGVDLEYDVLVTLLDLVRGPATVSVGGEPRAARALLQTIAAQLDARLPAGALTVADGVHDQYGGPDPATAIAAAEGRAAPGEPAFAVCAMAPPGRRPTGGARLIAGEARGAARLIETARGGGVLVHGTQLCADAFALPAAVAEIFGELPPYPTPGHPGDDLVEPALAPPGRAVRPGDAPSAAPGLPGLSGPAPPGLGAPSAGGPTSGAAKSGGLVPPGDDLAAASHGAGQPVGGPIPASAMPPGGLAVPGGDLTVPIRGTAQPAGGPISASAGPPGGPATPPPPGTAAPPLAGAGSPPPGGTASPPPPAGKAAAVPGSAAVPADDDLVEPEAQARPAGVSSSGRDGRSPDP